MTIYMPYYDRGYHVLEADTERARKIGKYWHYCGCCYGSTAYTTEAGAQAYIDKRYSVSIPLEYNPA